MKMSIAPKIMAFAAVAMSACAFAGSPMGSKPLNFEEFKRSCSEPAQFQSQIPPANIQISCKDLRHVWVPADSGTVALDEHRQVETELMSDKYHVNAETNAVAMPEKAGVCPRFKQLEETFTVQRSVDCSDILAYKGDLTDYCTTNLDSSKDENAKLVSARETGRVIDTCRLEISSKEQEQTVKGYLRRR
jgi:hypothetical protein